MLHNIDDEGCQAYGCLSSNILLKLDKKLLHIYPMDAVHALVTIVSNWNRCLIAGFLYCKPKITFSKTKKEKSCII